MVRAAYEVRPLFDPESSTLSYIVSDRDSGRAVLIDPVLEQIERDLKLVGEMGIDLAYVLETHVHADHITAASTLRDRTSAKIAYGAANAVEGADIFLREGDEIRIGRTVLRAVPTPGHTNGCTSYVLDGAVFTGDALFIRGCGRTDFQGGSPETLFDSVRNKLFSLPDDTIVYPGHDYKGMVCSMIGEEKKHNPRLKMANSRSQFVEIMNGLNLAYPKKIDVAVPVNLKAGKIDSVA